jgi:hypothetical protein
MLRSGTERGMNRPELVAAMTAFDSISGNLPARAGLASTTRMAILPQDLPGVTVLTNARRSRGCLPKDA